MLDYSRYGISLEFQGVQYIVKVGDHFLIYLIAALCNDAVKISSIIWIYRSVIMTEE